MPSLAAIEKSVIVIRATSGVPLGMSGVGVGVRVAKSMDGYIGLADERLSRRDPGDELGTQARGIRQLVLSSDLIIVLELVDQEGDRTAK